jgi:hypothetical protein
MHEMARHAIHSSETLAMATETLTSIIKEQDNFIADVSRMAMKYRQTGKDLRYISTLFKSLHLRSKALEERLRNEINLVFLSRNIMHKFALTNKQAFNVVAQHDSRIAMRIADATQVDSAAMKTIAILGLVFLPGTFICVSDLWHILDNDQCMADLSRHYLVLHFSASPQAATRSHRAGWCLKSSGSTGL